MPETRVYVGNLPFACSEEELARIFRPYGEVASVELIVKRQNGRPRGFAYVEMRQVDGARSAIEGLDGVTFSGRTLKVAQALPPNHA